MSYYDKYLKYKTKYLELKKNFFKKQQIGGDKPFIQNINEINLFDDPEMAELMNPIYGLYMCENGYISNNYWLKRNGFIDTPDSIKIGKISKNIDREVKPTNELIYLLPLDYGRFIALLYIQYKINLLKKTSKGIFIVDKYEFNIRKNGDDKKLIGYAKKCEKLKDNIDIVNPKQIDFYLVLYCLWWVANNDEGIKQYYAGINEVFNIINSYLPNDKKFYINNPNNTNSINDNIFEKIVFEITKKDFIIYNQEWSRNFIGSDTYPDCGETTLRNFVNLLCFDGRDLDSNLIDKFNPIPELKQYYEVFGSFKLQSPQKDVKNIYGMELNARDAWSYLIINYVKNDIQFKHRSYEIKSGISQNEKVTNLFQALKNLFPEADNYNFFISNQGIDSIEDNTNNGIGEIIITHNKLKNNIIIYCLDGHSYMEILTNDILTTDTNDLPEKKQQEMIEILLKNNINITNYLWINFNSELL